MKFSPEFLQEIKQKNNLLDLVQEIVVLRKTGSNYQGLCPFHSERTPSFSVSEEKQLYHCYGCKKGGDLVSFVMETQGLSFSEAVLDLANRAGVRVPEEYKNLKTHTPSVSSNAVEYKLNRFVAGFFRMKLEQSDSAKEYLRQRGLSSVIQEQYYVGYAEDSWDSLSRFLAEKKAPLDTAKKLGLVKDSKKPGSLAPTFDLFRDRVIFPIADLRGKISGFGGRALTPSSDTPKYMNSPESPVYQKSEILYGFFQAQKHIREKDEVLIAEGYFDVLSLVQAGFPQTVGTCGTALTQSHLKICSKFCSKIFLLFDSDSAGKMAMQKSMELGLRDGISLYGIFMEGAKDPDEWMKSERGAEELAMQMLHPKTLLDHFLETLLVQSKRSPEEKIQAVKEASRIFSLMRDQVAKQIRVKDFAPLMGVSESLLLGHTSSENKAPQQNQPRPLSLKRPTSKVEDTSGLSMSDRMLLGPLFSDERCYEIWKRGLNQLPRGFQAVDLFDTLQAKSTYLEFQEDYFSKNQPFSPENYLNAHSPDEFPEVRGFIIKIQMREQGHAGVNMKQFEAGMMRKVSGLWARFSHVLKSDLTQAEANHDKELEQKLQQEYLDVQRKIKELGSLYAKA